MFDVERARSFLQASDLPPRLTLGGAVNPFLQSSDVFLDSPPDNGGPA